MNTRPFFRSSRSTLAIVICLVSASFLPMPLAAQTYKCTDAKGGISFQQMPCPGKSADANQVAVKPVPLIGGSTAQTNPTGNQGVDAGPDPGTPRFQREPMHQGAEPQYPGMPPRQRGRNGEVSWCRDRQGQFYPTAPGQSCASGSTALPAGTEPDFNQFNRPQQVIPGSADGMRPTRIQGAYNPDPTLRPQHLSNDDDEACEQARANSKRQYDTNRNLSFDQRSALDEQVRSVCN